MNREMRAGAATRKPLWQLSITVGLDAEEALTSLITEILGCPASSYTEVESRLTTVTVFLGSKQLWSGTARQKLRAGLKRIGDCGLAIGPARISFHRIQGRDWAQAWKHHFKAIRIGGALVVRPSWKRVRVSKRQKTVVIDPGLSFGTGHHPTTWFCLQQLVTHRKLAGHRSFLDLGTGSGILAIAAAKLGFAPVLALEVDPEALVIARANARRNRVAGKIVFRQKDISKLPKTVFRRYSVVCANLITPVLLSERARILAHMEQSGVLILAGILTGEFKTIKAAYGSEGLKLIESRVEREWCSGTFVKPEL